MEPLPAYYRVSGYEGEKDQLYEGLSQEELDFYAECRRLDPHRPDIREIACEDIGFWRGCAREAYLGV